MTHRKSVSLETSNCLDILRQKIKEASAVITNNGVRCRLLSPFFGPSPWGSLELLGPKRIDRDFAEGNLKEMTNITTNAARVLYEFSDEIAKETGKSEADIVKKASDILELAIQSNAFTGRRHHFRFYKHETNLDRIDNLKNYIESNERRIRENDEAKTRFSNT